MKKSQTKDEQCKYSEVPAVNYAKIACKNRRARQITYKWTLPFYLPSRCLSSMAGKLLGYNADAFDLGDFEPKPE